MASAIAVSCNFSSIPTQLHTYNPRISNQKPPNPDSPSSILSRTPRFWCGIWRNNRASTTKFVRLRKLEKGRPLLQKFCCYSSSDTEQKPQEPFLENGFSLEEGDNGGGGEGRDWTSSVLLFGLYAGLMYYVIVLAPNQTPTMDMYFLKKLLNVIRDDGFRMNEVLVALWYSMGMFPLLYSMLLIPSARSEKNGLPVWPFLILSFFLGAYGLIPYFILWRPPPPPIDETELRNWPLNFLDSKLTAGIHLMSIDFALLSTFAPFWVYNDMTARKWYDRGLWLLPLSLVPLLGPALYLLLRPSLLAVPALVSESTPEEKS